MGSVEGGAHHEALAAHLGDVGHAGQLLAQVGTYRLGGLVKLAGAQLLERGAGRRHGELAAAEGRALHAGLEHPGSLAARHAGAARHARGDALGQGENVRHDALNRLEAEGLAAAVQARLHLVEDDQAVVGVGELAHMLQVLVAQRPHAALALDGLHHDCAHVRAHGCVECGAVVGGHGAKAHRQRLERLLEPVLRRGGQRLHGASVEAALERNDGLALRALVLDGPAARRLHRALVGFGTGVGKERLPAILLPCQAADLLGNLTAVLGVEVVGGLQQLASLLGDGGRHRRVGVTQRAHGNAGEKVEVLGTFVIIEVDALAAHKELRAAIGVHHVGGIEFAGLVQSFAHGSSPISKVS